MDTAYDRTEDMKLLRRGKQDTRNKKDIYMMRAEAEGKKEIVQVRIYIFDRSNGVDLSAPIVVSSATVLHTTTPNVGFATIMVAIGIIMAHAEHPFQTLTECRFLQIEVAERLASPSNIGERKKQTYISSRVLLSMAPPGIVILGLVTVTVTSTVTLMMARSIPLRAVSRRRLRILRCVRAG